MRSIFGDMFADKDKVKLEFDVAKQEWKLNSWLIGGNCPNEGPSLHVSGGWFIETVALDTPEIISKTYEIRNVGDTELDWEVTYREDSAIWVSKAAGILPVGDIDIVTVSVNTAELSLGKYENLLEFRNIDAGILVPDSESGNTDRSVKISVVQSSLPIPMNVSAMLDSPNVALLSWTYDLALPEAGAMNGFLIESSSPSNNGGQWTRAAFLANRDVRQLKVADLTTDTVYEFRIRAVGEDVESAPVSTSLVIPAIVPTEDCQAFFSGLLAGDRQVQNWISEIYVIDQYSEYVGAGLHRFNELAFPKAVQSTFDGIAIDQGTRVIIYSESDFGGEVLYDRIGPAVINNSLFESREPYASYINGPWKAELEAIFPASVREWSESDMHDWSGGSLILECGY